MLEESSTAIMDRIFISTSTEAKALLLRNICDFLVSQTHSSHEEDKGTFRFMTIASKSTALIQVHRADANGADIDMSLLIGNADNFADSGCV